MATNDAAEARTVEMSLETLVKDEYARSFREAERAAHEEANTARAIANSRPLAEAFYRAAQAQELERLSREAARQDAAEERELAARELRAEQAAETELAARAEKDLRAAENLGHAQRRRRARERTQVAERDTSILHHYVTS